MSNGYGRFACGEEFGPCPPRPRQKCGCECEESPCTRDLRRELCTLQGQVVTLVGVNPALIAVGTVAQVNCGTVVLTTVTALGGTTLVTPLTRLVVSLCQLTAVTPGALAL